MKLKKWALVAEIGSALAVVLSLVFVGLQVRLGAEETAVNTAAIRTSAFQELQTQIADLNVLLIENPPLRLAVRRVLTGSQEPESDDQVELANSWLRLVFRHGEIAYTRHVEGLIDETDLDSVMGPIGGEIRSPYGRERWSRMREFLTPNMSATSMSRSLQSTDTASVDFRGFFHHSENGDFWPKGSAQNWGDRAMTTVGTPPFRDIREIRDR